MEKDTKVRVASRLEQIAAIATYCAVGPALIFLNRHLMVEKQFKYPASLTAGGLLASWIFSHAAVFSGCYKLKHRETVDAKFYLAKIMPIGLGQAGTIITGNIGYLYLSVAFIQILKSFAPVVLVFVLCLAQLEKMNLLLGVSLAIISIGSLGAVQGELRFSVFGFWMIIASEFIEAFKLVSQQNLMGSLKFEIVEGLFWMSPAGFAWMALYSYVVEYDRMIADNALAIVMDQLHLFCSAALLGLGVNFCSFWVSKACSALTLKICAISRNIGIVMISPMLLGEVLPMSQFGWYMFSTTGIVLYNYIRMNPNVTERYTLGRLLGSDSDSESKAIEDSVAIDDQPEDVKPLVEVVLDAVGVGNDGKDADV